MASGATTDTSPRDPEWALRLLAINLTRRCNLACSHCYLDAKTLRDGDAQELTCEQVCTLLDQVASRSNETMVVLTGGEPLVRRDLEAMVSHGAGLGLAMVVGTNGVLLGPRRVRSLKAAGVLGVGISLDSLDEAYHDDFRGRRGAWRRTMAGIETCRRLDLSFQIHFSVADGNAAELPAMIDFARAAGARVLNVFFLVCTGRGEAMSDVSPLRYERVLQQLIDAQSRFPDLIIRARCAPHFKRIAHQRAPDSPLNRIAGRDGDGCIAGIHYCRITPEGHVTACPYIERSEGSVHRQPLLDIWDHATSFQRLRSPRLGGKCGACEYRELCGGCRARPHARGGDLLDADPLCAYVPGGGPVVRPLLPDAGPGLRWSPAAEARLARVPAFLQRLVRTRAEAYVAELGETEVTPAHLSALAARRFGGPPPFARDAPPGKPS